MSEEANEDMIFDAAAERLALLFSHLRVIIPNSPNPSLPDTKAEDVYKSLKTYQGEEKEVLYFANMDEKTFLSVFAHWQNRRLKTVK